ncbi:RNA polymerase sigma factor [Streptomyces sp. NPDC091217]|uniref:RNA polymerase sigma factor n=1 Tax=Streptomyces sp. NPDC091217 TaxID=3365975 RepID=UPI003821A51B
MDDWERFYLLYHQKLYSFCLARLRGLLPDNEDYTQAADDIAQETMIIAHRKFEIWDSPERALWQTAQRKVYEKCAGYTIVTGSGFPITVRHSSHNVWEDQAQEVSADPTETMIDKVVLYSALHGLSVEQRQSLIAHKALSLSAAEASRVLSRPATTVKAQAKRAIELLREAAAKGALIILPAGVAVGIYETLKRAPLETVANGATDWLNQPHTYTVLIGLAIKHGVPYLRDRFRQARTPDHMADVADGQREPRSGWRRGRP